MDTIHRTGLLDLYADMVFPADKHFFILHPVRYSTSLFYTASIFLLFLLIVKKRSFNRRYLLLLSGLWFCFFFLVNPFTTRFISQFGSVLIFERLLPYCYFFILIPVVGDAFYRVGCALYIRLGRFLGYNKMIRMFFSLVLCIMIFIVIHLASLAAGKEIKTYVSLSLVVILLAISSIRVLFGTRYGAEHQEANPASQSSIRQYLENVNIFLCGILLCTVIGGLVAFQFFMLRQLPVFSQYNQSVLKERYASVMDRFNASKEPYIAFMDTLETPSVFIANRRDLTYHIISNTKHFTILWDRMGWGTTTQPIQDILTKDRMDREEFHKIIRKFHIDYICFDLRSPVPAYIFKYEDLFHMVFRDSFIMIVKVKEDEC